MPVYNEYKDFYTEDAIHRLDSGSQEVSRLGDGTSHVATIVKRYHDILSSPLALLYPNGQIKTITPNPSGVTEQSQTLHRILSEKMQPGSPLHDRARGFFSEYVGEVVLDSVARKSHLGEFRVLKAPPQCDMPDTQEEKSGDLLLAKVTSSSSGQEVLQPLVLFEIKASQRNSKLHRGINYCLGVEVPVVTVCMGDMTLFGTKETIAEYSANHPKEIVYPSWFKTLHSRQQESLILDARHEVTKGCQVFLDDVDAVFSQRRIQRPRALELQDHVALAIEVLGIHPKRYIQYKLGA